jgi:hypothetical protein
MTLSTIFAALSIRCGLFSCDTPSLGLGVLQRPHYQAGLMVGEGEHDFSLALSLHNLPLRVIPCAATSTRA